MVKKWRIENDGQEITKFTLPSALQSLLLDNKDKFAKNVQAGFQTCGLFPFGADFVNYNRIIKDTDPKTIENRHEVAISESSYISYLESKIVPNILKVFYTTFNSGKDWEGNKEASMLYDIWLYDIYKIMMQKEAKENYYPDVIAAKKTLKSQI